MSSSSDPTSAAYKAAVENLGLKPNIAVTGLNPHCESIDKYNEDEKILILNNWSFIMNKFFSY